MIGSATGHFSWVSGMLRGGIKSLFFSYGPKGGGVLASPKNTYLKIPIFQKGGIPQILLKRAILGPKTPLFAIFFIHFSPFWSLSEKTDFFLLFFIKGGVF